MTYAEIMSTKDTPAWRSVDPNGPEKVIVFRGTDKHVGKVLGNGQVGEALLFVSWFGGTADLTLSEFASRFVRI